MRLKYLVILTVISFLCEVIFGIYYSISIVDQNVLFNSQETNLGQLTIENQQLEIKLSTLGSLSHTLDFAQSKSYVPVSTSINLN